MEQQTKSLERSTRTDLSSAVNATTGSLIVYTLTKDEMPD